MMNDLNLKVLNTLESSTLQQAATIFLSGKELSNEAEVIECMMAWNHPALIQMMLPCTNDIDELKRVAEVVAANITGLDEDVDAMKGEIIAKLTTIREVHSLGDKKPLYDSLLRLAEDNGVSVMALVAAPPTPSDSPIAYWNSSYKCDDADWILVDLSRHPDETIRADQRALIKSLPELDGKVMLIDAPLAKPGEEWLPLFAVEMLEPARFDVIESQLPDQLKSDESLQEKYQNDWGSKRLDNVLRSDDQPAQKIYAQLGGFNVSWSCESEQEQSDRRLIVRTFVDSEPWVEAFKSDDGKFVVRSRIT